MGIVRWFAWPGDAQVRPLMVNPEIDQGTGELGSIAGKKVLRRSTLTNETAKNLNDIPTLITRASRVNASMTAKARKDCPVII